MTLVARLRTLGGESGHQPVSLQEFTRVRLAALVPHLAGLRLRQVTIEEHRLTFAVEATRRTAPCPLCHRTATRVHSRYVRTLVDLPWAGRGVRLHLDVRRFRCRTRACARRIFAERFPRLGAAFARRTHVQRAALADVGFEVGGSAGARLARKQGLVGSRATILRVVHAAALPEVGTPRVLGVDDWARRRGQTYGTILVDLERRRPVDLLEDRTAPTFAAWLKDHPGIAIISRDRGGAYADGARQGAPKAVQVADRFHLLGNIGDALERVLARHHGDLRVAAAAVDRAIAEAGETRGPDPEPVASTPPPRRGITRAQQDREARRSRRVARYEAVVDLHRQGASLRTIAHAVGLSRATARRFVRAGTFPERAPSAQRPTSLTPYEPYLRARWTAGCHNARVLWKEVRSQGFPGAAVTVGRLVSTWRLTPGRPGPTPRGDRPAAVAPTPALPRPTRVLSPRQARWLLLRPVADLRPDDHLHRDALLRQGDQIRAARVLAEEFGRLVRARDRGALVPWLDRATASDVIELREFAAVLRRDQAAVDAALTYEWSNGQTEGQITRVKYLKRQMYGRASFRLLKQRVLRAA
jgi:transposase